MLLPKLLYIQGSIAGDAELPPLTCSEVAAILCNALTAAQAPRKHACCFTMCHIVTLHVVKRPMVFQQW